MRKRIMASFAVLVAAAVLLAGCGGEDKEEIKIDKDAVLKAGTYTGQSSESKEEDGGGYAIVKLTVGDDHEIEKLDFKTYDKNGNPKSSENYGMVNGKVEDQERYDSARAAVKACEEYAEQYMVTKDLEEVDAISGATISYEQFKEALSIALQKAAE